MKLSARVVTNFATVNNFDFANQWDIRSGEPNTLYFQLVDLDQVDKNKTPLRYIPAVGTTMQVKFPSIDDDEVVLVTPSRNATDGSIWSVALSATQTPASGNVIFTITESAVLRSFSVVNALVVEIVGMNGAC